MYSEDADGNGEGSSRSNRNSSRDRNARDDLQSQGERYAFKGPKPKAHDPFFDKPYEAAPVTASVDGAAVTATPAWEAAAKASPARAGKSANIRSKKRVAALFQAIAAPVVVAPVQEPAEIN